MRTRERTIAFAGWWNRDRLWGSLAVFWTATVFSAMLGSGLFPIKLPAIGAIFPFRVLLPVTAALYILYALREKQHIWRDASAVERWCYILAAAMLIRGAASLPQALDTGFTFRRLFNLIFDLCLFLLALRLLRDRRLLRPSALACAAGLAVLLAMGLYRMVTAGDWDEVTNRFALFFFYKWVLRGPDSCWGNPNDFSAVITFTVSIFLLASAVLWKKLGKKWRWTPAAALVLLYFVCIANSARLIKICFWLLFAGFTVFLLLSDRRRLWIPLVVLVLMGCIWFLNQYRFIMPSIREYFAQMEIYRQQEEDPYSQNTPAPPKLDIKTQPKTSLDEEFFSTDEATGEKVLSAVGGSGGIRALLLLHSADCFRESYGLGAGLGNTETLAPRRNIIPGWAHSPQNSVHCFLVRSTADLGVFFLFPLCIVAFLLLKRTWELLTAALRTRNPAAFGAVLLYFCVLLVFPIASTASSDSQDILPMWLYLAAIVIFAAEPDALKPRL